MIDWNWLSMIDWKWLSRWLRRFETIETDTPPNLQSAETFQLHPPPPPLKCPFHNSNNSASPLKQPVISRSYSNASPMMTGVNLERFESINQIKSEPRDDSTQLSEKWQLERHVKCWITIRRLMRDWLLFLRSLVCCQLLSAINISSANFKRARNNLCSA